MAELDSDWTDHGSAEDHADQLDLLSMQAVDGGNYGDAAILHVAADCVRGLSGEIEVLRESLREVMDRDMRNTCQHEETHRGGAIWEICNSCGAKWADDEGGRPEWQDPPEWTGAHKALAAHDRGEK